MIIRVFSEGDLCVTFVCLFWGCLVRRAIYFFKKKTSGYYLFICIRMITVVQFEVSIDAN